MFKPRQVVVNGTATYPTLLSEPEGRPVLLQNTSKTVSVVYGGDLGLTVSNNSNGVILPGATHVHDGMEQIYGITAPGQVATIQVIPGAYLFKGTFL